MNILVDGDIVAYRAAYSCEGDTEEAAIEKVDSLMDDILFDTTTRGEEAEVFLTGKGNFRYKLSSAYKANRKDTPRPEHLGLVRDHLVKEWAATVSEGQEADDLIATRATELDYDCTIVSTDKDFKQIPCRHYNPNKRDWAVVGDFEATVFFYTQILTGDRSDNVEGIYGVGPVKAKKILDGCSTEQELYDKTLAAYDNDSERMITNARLLWLRRKEEELWLPPDQR